MYRSIIDQYEAGAGSLKEVIASLSPAQLASHPVPGKWSIQQLVLHVMDADLVLTERMKRVIAEENPTLLAFSENNWMERLEYSRQPAEEAVQLFELNRGLFSRVLRHLPLTAYQRAGVHSERGNQTLADILRFSTTHLEHHLKFAHEKRHRLLAAT
jgi:uncharacterized damage-inducible protein DinB